MHFRTWFTKWIFSFLNLFTVNSKRRLTKKQLEKQRLRRLKAKYSSENLYRTKRKYRKRRSSMEVFLDKSLNAVLKFFGVSLGVLLLPFGLLDFGRQKVRAWNNSKRTISTEKKSELSDNKKSTRRRSNATNTAGKTTFVTHSFITEHKSVVQAQPRKATDVEDKKRLTLEEMRNYKLSVVKNGESDVQAIVNDEDSLATLWKNNIDIFFVDYISKYNQDDLRLSAVKNLQVCKGKITAEIENVGAVSYKIIIIK